MSLELLVISNKHRLYLIHSVSQHLRRNHFQYQSLVLYSPHEGQSLNFPFQAQLLIVYCLPFYMAQCLGFNLAPSSIFFLLSPPSHLYHILTQVLCCGYTSFKSSQQFSFFVARFCSVSTYKFPYMLTKIFVAIHLTTGHHLSLTS